MLEQASKAKGPSRNGKSSQKRAAQNAALKTGSVDVLCIICAESILFSAISPCNNITCHKCCLRQRALYKKNTCLVCRTDHDDVVISEQIFPEEVKFADFVEQSRAIASSEHGLHFTSEEAMKATLSLLEMKCTECSAIFPRFGQLNDHVKSAHGNRQYCDICASHKRAFLSELKLYTHKELEKHINDGDRTGFKGHPRCRFCRNKRFYSDDELTIHIRDRHERCYLCDQDHYVLHDYYRNYDDLYSHFRALHYVCLIPLCVEKRFVVFREDLDLTAHMLKEHGGIMSKNGRLVVGATSVSFQLQLSTVPMRGPALDIDTQRRRLEERAKHYLHGSADDLATFKKLYQSFKAKKLSALDLVYQYKSLFKDTDYQDMALLVHEMVQLLPGHTDQGAQLQAAFDAARPKSEPVVQNHFPVLGGQSSSSHVFTNLSWGGNSRPQLRDELFPTLAKPSRSNSPVVQNGPVRYITVKKKPAAESRPVMSIKNFEAKPKAFAPTYLDKPAAKSNQSAFPSLGLGSNSRSNSQVPSRSQSPSTSIASKSLTKLSDSQFPALEIKKKSTIPPVKPIPKPSATWNLGLSPAEAPKKDDWGIPIVDKKAEKLRLKQERMKKK